MAFTACSDDTEPKADYPTNHDFLNIPVMANQTIVLETAGSVDFTLSQPDYGVAIVPDYALQISLDPSFEKLPSEIASVAPIVYSTEKERLLSAPRIVAECIVCRKCQGYCRRHFVNARLR